MRVTIAVLIALSLSAGTLAGCSGSLSSSSSLPGGGNPVQSRRSGAFGFNASSGHLLRYAALGHLENALDIQPVRRKADRGNVYISDSKDGVKVFKNGLYTYLSSMTNGISTPDGEWTDTNRNLYVTNYRAGNVVEYSCTTNACSGSPTFTYDTGLNNVNVTTDRSGNVYVADFGGSYSGEVNEYAQDGNVVLNTCAFSYGVTGVAVDSATGDVFVAYGDGGTHGFI
jgi:hypothetical protein